MAVCLLVVLLISGIAVIVERGERRALIDQVRKRAVATASNVAAVSTSALLTYNYVTLEQNAARVAREEDVLYVIILDREGKVAAHSSRSELQGTVMADPVSRRAGASREILVQAATFSGTADPLYDVAVPVYIKESPEKWGTVRVGISLGPMRRAIARSRQGIALMGLVAIALGGAGALLLARRITSPIARLVHGAVEVGKGNLDQQIPLSTGDEIGTLARTFNEMTNNLRTSRLSVESAHRELKSQYKEISFLKDYNDNVLKSMTSGVLTLDLGGRIVTVNQAAVQITGLAAEDMVGKPCEPLFPGSPELPEALLDVLRKERRTPQVIHLRYPRPDGKTLFLEMTTVGLQEETGKLIGALGVIRDLTHERELEEQLRRADRLAALGTMAAGIAHEIKNPLTSLKTFAQLFPKRSGDPGFQKKFTEIVPHELERIHLLAEDLMELARPTQMHLRPADVHSLIDRVLKTHEDMMKGQGIEFRFHPEPTSHPQPLVDPEYLYRALTNLVLNAIQAMPAGGLLEIRTGVEAFTNGDREDPHFVLHVRDTGTGIPGDKLGDLFTPFFTTKAKGTGLGLAITHKIVEGHGGQIRVESRMGMGTQFSVSLPLRGISRRI
ncbi:MAG: HAMP domain-containing protein [Candidatus Tectomicrobia bacterium]|uniref:histidine kinase n=1 Tax=Tectimicrobiota bacterium TaxID=2528274 RepID=A0A932GPE1_UNCTE|nr:HAMP domain-containing protein [Candidatus Tectomicrobia bacterium]